MKVRVAMRLTDETRGFHPGYIKGWTYVRTYSVRTFFSEPKFLGCIVYQIFLPMMLRCGWFARESSAKFTFHLC